MTKAQILQYEGALLLGILAWTLLNLESVPLASVYPLSSMCEGEIKLPIIAQCKHNYHTRELGGGCRLPLPTSTVHTPAAGGNICQSINFTLGRSFFTIHFIMYYVGILADGNV